MDGVENLLGERFEVRSYPDTTRPAEFRRIPVGATDPYWGHS